SGRQLQVRSSFVNGERKPELLSHFHCIGRRHYKFCLLRKYSKNSRYEKNSYCKFFYHFLFTILFRFVFFGLWLPVLFLPYPECRAHHSAVPAEVVQHPDAIFWFAAVAADFVVDSDSVAGPGFVDFVADSDFDSGPDSADPDCFADPGFAGSAGPDSAAGFVAVVPVVFSAFEHRQDCTLYPG